MNKKKILFQLRKNRLALLILLTLFGLTVFFVFRIYFIRQEIVELRRLPPWPERRGLVRAKGIYLSSWTASEEETIDDWINFILETELNAVIIDVKDSTGWISYWSRIPQAEQYGTRQIRISDLEQLLEKFHRRGIYTIARIVVFKDPVLAERRPDLALRDSRTGEIWKDYQGQAWLDFSSHEVWDYNITLAKEAFLRGFKEVNFDYIRSPSDGPVRYIQYPLWDGRGEKYDVIRDFFRYQEKELADFGPRSADIFGLTLWYADDQEIDMNIGQRVVDTLDYFDYICPMVYPSHFPPDFEEFANPAEHPYPVIYRSLVKVQNLLAERERPRVRPWLQAFSQGAIYDSAMLDEEKRAVEDGQGYGWLLWNARNQYSIFKDSLTWDKE